MNYLLLWKTRRAKFYNPDRKCKFCHGQVSPHKFYCNACIDLILNDGRDHRDYHETVQSVLARF